MNEGLLESEVELFEDPFTENARELSDSEVARNFMSCIFIFIMQMTMSITVYTYDDSNITSSSNDMKTDPLFITYIVRLMCALALHMLIEPEVFQAINMIKFSLYRCNNLQLRNYQICVALMQLLGALLTEFVNIILICDLTSAKDIVMNFVTFASIS
jgi:hypothetical protein